jgi:hypothetical protein
MKKNENGKSKTGKEKIHGAPPFTRVRCCEEN